MADLTPDLIGEFTAWLAGRLDLSMVAKPFGLWAHAIEEQPGNLADPATVVRTYPGGRASSFYALGHALVQAYTIAGEPRAALARGWSIDAALHDDDGRPRIELQLPNFRIAAVAEIRSPGVIGRDAQNRVEVTQNFELFYTRL